MLSLPLQESSLAELTVGERVALWGPMLAARDAAHKRLAQLAKEGKAFPVSLQGETLYYTGPSPARRGKVVGAAGPTTSARMDPYTPLMLSRGLKAMVGKGDRSDEIIEVLRKHKAVYFAAVGGTGALMAQHITHCEVIAYADLASEAIFRLQVKGLPVIVAIDVRGNDLFRVGPEQFRR